MLLQEFCIIPKLVSMSMSCSKTLSNSSRKILNSSEYNWAIKCLEFKFNTNISNYGFFCYPNIKICRDNLDA